MRLHYVYPYPHVDDVIDRMTTDPAVGGLLPYLDVPFQHASPRILKLMKRPANAEGTLRRIEAWRAMRPDLVIRSTFIAGFPGETEAEFGELLAFLEAAQLDRVGCFAYSPVDGAAANALPDPVPVEVREDRRARFMAVQEKISAGRLARRVGSTITVLVDGHEGRDRDGPQRRGRTGDRRHRPHCRRRRARDRGLRAGDGHAARRDTISTRAALDASFAASRGGRMRPLAKPECESASAPSVRR